VLGLHGDRLVEIANRFPTVTGVQVEPTRHERDARGARKSPIRTRVVLPGVITARLASEPHDHVAERVGGFIELRHRGEHSLEPERVGVRTIRGAIRDERRGVDRDFASPLQRVRRVAAFLVAVGIRAIDGERDVFPHRGREWRLFDDLGLVASGDVLRSVRSGLAGNVLRPGR